MSLYLLGIDIGTSACRATLFTPDGVVVAQANEEYAVDCPRPGWAQQQPDMWWQAICHTVSAILSKNSIRPETIAGIGVGGQSWSAVALDAQGRVLLPTPIWTDTRSIAECDAVKRLVPEQELFELCGNPLQPGYTLPKILWYKNHCREAYDNAAAILQSNSFIVYRLTGVMTQDLSQGYGLCCFDTRRGQWDYQMAARLGLRSGLLPDIVPSHAVVGKVQRAATLATGLCEGTPVVAGGLDAACGTLGAGVISHGQTQEQGGQAGGMSLCIDRYISDPRLILGFHVVPERWLLQGGTTGGGGAFKWLRKTVCPHLSFEEMSACADTVPPGSDGLIFLPYMAGERSPIWNPEAKGVFFGLDYQKTTPHLIRAVMEGVAFALRHNLETAERAGANPDVLSAMGGSANSPVWTQIKSDVTGHRVQVRASDTATAWGAAMLAGVGVGLFKNFEDVVGHTVPMKREHTPDAKHQAVYDKRYADYRELYERLKPMMAAEES